MRALILFFISLHALSQTSFKPLTNEDELLKGSLGRTIFIRAYEGADRNPDNAVRATGVILKGGYLITNEHVMRPFTQGKSITFQIFTQGRLFHTFQEVYLLGCNPENDICLLKTKNNYNDPYFSLETPPFRKISASAPLGLFKGEKLYFNGFCSAWPKMQKTQYVDYVTNGYYHSINPNRKKDTPSLQFADLNGDSIACGGDSGGPIFDQNLYLYGIVRDFQNSTNDPKKARNYAVPMNIINDVFNQYKDKALTIKVPTLE